MQVDVIQALNHVGFLSEDQLAQYFGLERHSLPNERWFLWYRGALWDGRRFNKGSQRRHAELRAEVYCRLLPILTEWTTHWALADAFRPDALFAIEGHRENIALEVDTGSERARDWLEKLTRYYTAPEDCRMMVVADGQAKRQGNLAALLARESPIPWQVIPVESVTPHHLWIWEQPAVPIHPPIAPEPAPLGTTMYVLDGSPVSAAHAENGLARGRFFLLGSERRHRQHIIFLRRRPVSKFFRRIGRKSQPNPRIHG